MARRLARMHRGGAVAVGLFLGAFGTAGLVAGGATFLSTEGEPVLGLSSNGLLAVLSLVVGAILVGSGLRGDAVASMVTAVFGGLFLLSGLGHLAVLDTRANLLAFEISNVVFSIVVGLVLVITGLYGRVSGALPADNPYRVRREQRRFTTASGDAFGGAGRTDPESEDEQAMIEAELAMAEGHPTPVQAARYMAEARRRADAEHQRAWERYYRRWAGGPAGRSSGARPVQARRSRSRLGRRSGAEADVPADRHTVGSRVTGGEPGRDGSDSAATTGVGANEMFVGRVAGPDLAESEPSGAEVRAHPTPAHRDGGGGGLPGRMLVSTDRRDVGRVSDVWRARSGRAVWCSVRDVGRDRLVPLEGSSFPDPGTVQVPYASNRIRTAPAVDEDLASLGATAIAQLREHYDLSHTHRDD